MGVSFGVEPKMTEEGIFVNNVENFRDIYILRSSDKKVMAVRERFPDKEILIAEYENFKTPVCDYVTEDKIDQPLLKRSPLAAAAGDVQRVEAFAGLDFLWPQLTGKLRIIE